MGGQENPQYIFLGSKKSINIYFVGPAVIAFWRGTWDFTVYLLGLFKRESWISWFSMPSCLFLPPWLFRPCWLFACFFFKSVIHFRLSWQKFNFVTRVLHLIHFKPIKTGSKLKYENFEPPKDTRNLLCVRKSEK